MDSATEDIYLQKLAEFVYDNENIVTSRWLSITLDISIQQSQCLLEKYASDAKDMKNKEVALTYLVSGLGEDGSLHITISKENDKPVFNKILNRCIYSIQKCKDVDFNILGMVDFFDVHHHRNNPILGSTISKQCVQRIVKTKKPIPSEQKPEVQSKPSFFQKLPPKSTENPSSQSTSAFEKASSKPNNVSKTKAKTKQKNGISSFFNKTAGLTDVKPASTNVVVDDKCKIEIKPEIMSTQKRIHDLVDSESDSEEVVTKSQSVPKSNTINKTKSTKRRPKKANVKAPSPKRRKRIVEQNSDSDDIFGSDTKEDMENTVVISEEEEEVAKSKPTLAPKNKRRKLVDHTYQDDEGYFITSKEWIEEDPSDDEATPEMPKSDKDVLKLEDQFVGKDKKLMKTESSEVSDTTSKEKKVAGLQSTESSAKTGKDSKIVNGKSKGTKKGKKPVPANQPTIMSFFKRA